MSTKKKQKAPSPVVCYAQVKKNNKFTCYDLFSAKGLKIMREECLPGERIIKVKIVPVKD